MRCADRVAVVAMLAIALVAAPAHGNGTDAAAIAPSSPDRPWRLPSPAEVALRMQQQGAPFLPGATIAEDASAPVHAYDLPALIDLAQRTNPATREAWEQARRAAFAVGLSESEYAPQIAVEAIAGFQRTPLPAPKTVVPAGYFVSSTREIIPTIALKWLLFDFGRREAELSTARANAFVANVAFTGAHQKVIFEVTKAYHALAAARARVDAARQALRTADTVHDATESRRERGLATSVVVAQARRQVAEAQYNLVKADADDRVAYARLLSAIGLAPDTQLHIADLSQRALPAEPAARLGQVIEEALTRRPDILAALGRVEAAEGSVMSAKAAWYPRISLVAQVFQNAGSLSSDGGPYSNVNKTGGNVLLALSVPLLDGGARDARLSMAQSGLESARAKLAEARDTAALQVATTYNELASSLAAYAATLEVTAAARTAYEAALESYALGVGTYTDLAAEEGALARAEAARVDAHASVFTAAAALALVTGALGAGAP